MYHKVSKSGALAAAALAMGLGGGFGGAAAAQSLTVTGFGGAMQDALRGAYFQPYAEQSGVDLTEDSYLGGISKIKAMVDTNSVVWDVVQMDEDEMLLACEQGLLESVDVSKLDIDGELMDQATRNGDCGVGFFVWSLVLGYDADKLDQAPTSWADMWDLETWPGDRGLRKRARTTLEIALMADGVAPDDVYDVLGTKKGVDRAFAKLDEIKDHVIWWESGAQAPEWLASGDLALAAAYNGRLDSANESGRNFGMVWKNQIYAMDFWTVVRGGDLEEGMKFIDFSLDAANQKKFTDEIPYGVVNLGANELIDPDRASQLPTGEENLKSGLPIDVDFWVDNEAELQTRFTQWLAN